MSRWVPRSCGPSASSLAALLSRGLRTTTAAAAEAEPGTGHLAEAGSSRCLVDSDKGLAAPGDERKQGTYMPPVGRELLAAVKLGIPGAKEEFDRQQERIREGFEARRRARKVSGMKFGFEELSKADLFASKDTKGYYKVLGLEGQEGSASVDEIKVAFRKQARVLHPDMHKNASSELQEKASEQFKFLVKAYTVLKDPSQRAFYDSSCMY